MIALGHDNNVTLYLGSDAVLKAYLGTELVYPNTTPSYDTQYRTFEAIDNGTSFQFNQNGLEYSLDDGSTWNSLGASVHTPSLNTGDKIMFRGNMSITQGYGIGQFSSNGHFNIEGNPLSLVDDTNFADITDFTGMNQIFFQLFNGTEVVDASNLALPATILSEDCYTSMFEHCTSLTTAPELPATTLARYCYHLMFSDCTSLTTAPELSATTLVDYCYSSMFKGCTSLTTAPELPATTLARYCYHLMFSDCTSLTTAPELPATTLASNCYGNMFQGCRNLNYIKAMFTTTPSNTYTSNWVQGVAATGTFVKSTAASWNVTGANGIPTGWTVQRDYPKIYKKYRATYSNSTTVDGDCDGNNLVINEVTKSGLKTVVIGECVPAIVGECFADCANLTSVIIEGNTSIDNYSFARNNGHLTSITMYSTTPPSCATSAFKYYKSGSGYVPMTSIKIYVPSQSVNAYKAASGWSTYASKIQAIPT